MFSRTLSPVRMDFCMMMEKDQTGTGALYGSKRSTCFLFGFRVKPAGSLLAGRAIRKNGTFMTASLSRDQRPSSTPLPKKSMDGASRLPAQNTLSRSSSVWSKCKPTYSELHGTKLALIVDDDEIGHLVISQCLEPLGYKVMSSSVYTHYQDKPPERFCLKMAADRLHIAAVTGSNQA